MLVLFGQALAVPGALMFLFFIWAAWSTGWMLRVLHELQRAHETAAQLALAEGKASDLSRPPRRLRAYAGHDLGQVRTGRRAGPAWSSRSSVDCVITGADIPDAYAETLAWVIREGVTNVLRHSRATRVTITTAVEPDEVALTVANDGASASGTATSSTGTGLRSMAERVQAIGGELEHRHDGDWFLLTASIPRVGEGAHDPRPAG